MSKKATLKDVALRAGVSLMAASAVLNRGKSTSRVSEATRARILEASREIGYQADLVAKSLRHNLAGAIGFYNGEGFIDPADHLTSEVFHGLHVECTQRNLDLLLYNGLHLVPSTAASLKLTENKVDGVVILPRPVDVELVRLLSLSDQPVVCLREPSDYAPSVVVNDADASRTLAAHLFERGHTAVIYRRSALACLSHLNRSIGFQTAAANLGLSIIETTSGPDGDLTDFERDVIAAHADRNITAIACCTDQAAYKAIAYCRTIGIKVPEDLSVVGFDGIPAPDELANVDLTTMKVDWLSLARDAIARLLQPQDNTTAPSTVVRAAEFSIGNTVARAFHR